MSESPVNFSTFIQKFTLFFEAQLMHLFVSFRGFPVDKLAVESFTRSLDTVTGNILSAGICDSVDKFSHQKSSFSKFLFCLASLEDKLHILDEKKKRKDIILLD